MNKPLKEFYDKYYQKKHERTKKLYREFLSFIMNKTIPKLEGIVLYAYTEAMQAKGDDVAQIIKNDIEFVIDELKEHILAGIK